MKLLIFLIFSSNIFSANLLSTLKERILKARLQAHIIEIESQCKAKKECVRQVPLRDFFENPRAMSLNGVDGGVDSATDCNMVGTAESSANTSCNDNNMMMHWSMD